MKLKRHQRDVHEFLHFGTLANGLKNLFLFMMIFFYITFLMAEDPRNSGGAWVFYDGDSVEKLDVIKMGKRVQVMKKGGSQFIRLWIPWSQVERSEGNWDFSKFDEIIAKIVSKGQKLFVTLCTVMSPQWYHAKMEQNPYSMFHVYYDHKDNSLGDKFYPENMIPDDKHILSETEVQSPHTSIWNPLAKRKAKKFVNKTFKELLNKWKPFIIYVHLSLGRLNEPNYPSTDKHRYFMCYDNCAIKDFRVYLSSPGKYSDISALNSAWGTSYTDFEEINPPTIPFKDLNSVHREDFLKWYIISKRKWIKYASNLVTNKIKNDDWIKYIIYVAGAEGDIKDCYDKFIDTNKKWQSLTDIEKKTIMTVRDNRWILEQAAQNSKWYIQYAGVNKSCKNDTLCSKIFEYAQAVNYEGPIYAQVPSYDENNMNQPFQVSEIVANTNYYGLHWNKDKSLFNNNNKINERYKSLKRGWKRIQEKKSGDWTPPSISDISHTSTKNSATIIWKTDDNADSCVIYGTTKKDLREVSEYKDYKNRVKSHSITLRGLREGTTYYYEVASTDENGNLCVSVSDGKNMEPRHLHTKSSGPPPVLISPINYNTTPTLNPVFKWNAVSAVPQVSNYEIRIFRNGGTNVLQTQMGIVTQYQILNNLECNEAYYWQIRAYNTCGWGPWSSPEYFKTPDKPGVPVINKPKNNEISNTLRPILKWYAVNSLTQVTEYKLWVFNTNGTEVLKTQVGNVTEYKIGKPLIINNSYYWKVRAHNAIGWGPWSSPAYFKTPGKPEAPDIIKPKNNEITNTLQPILKWYAVNSISPVTNYQLWIFNTNGAEVLKTQVGNVTEYKIEIPLVFNTSYYWKVRAHNECGWGSWSSPTYFKTPQTPYTPVIIKPKNNELTNTKRPVFRWEIVNVTPGVTNYQIRLLKNNGVVVLDITLGNVTQYQMGFKLDANRTYKWQIRAKNNKGFSSWSSLAFFRTPN